MTGAQFSKGRSMPIEAGGVDSGPGGGVIFPTSQVRGRQTDEGHTASKDGGRKQTPAVPSVLPKGPGKLPPFRYEKTTHRDSQTAGQDLLDGSVKMQMLGPPRTLLIRQVQRGAQSFAFLTSSPVVLMLLLQGPAPRAAGTQHRAP